MDDRAAKRVALAKDVLAQLAAKSLTPANGMYIYQGNGSECRVCAIGAMAVACCGAEPFAQFSGTYLRRRIAECLSPTFSGTQLDEIESVFEGYDAGTDVARDRRRLEFCGSVFGDPDDPDALSAEGRLHDIMQSIVENGGDFDPEQL